MLISAANLLTAALQGPRPSAGSPPPKGAAAANSTPNAAGFEPIKFKNIAPSSQPTAPAPQAPSLLQTIGSLLDIHI